MTIKFIGSTSGVELDTDSNKSIRITDGLSDIPTAGGYFTVAGGPAGIVAAALAANTTLMSMRMNPTAHHLAYIDKFRFITSVATVGTSALVPGKVGLQRFKLVTPSTGTQRQFNRQNEGSYGSDMFDIRDSASALTITGVSFLDVIATSNIAVRLTGGDEGNLGNEWIFEPKYPTVLYPGDGLCLRTQVAMPATQTWVYAYTVHWHEETL